MRPTTFVSAAALALALMATVAPPASAAPPVDTDVSPLELGSIVLQADTMTYDTDAQIVTANGNVEVYYGPRVLYADEVTYNEVTGVAVATGSVSLTDETGNVYFGDQITLSDEWRLGVVEGFRALIDKNARLAADEGIRKGEDRSELKDAVFSPCPVCEKSDGSDPLWQIRASKVVYDRKQKAVFYRNAVFEVKGIPVFYTPFFFHPDPETRRKTGFLIPTIGTSTELGTFVGTPFYLNLAPNYDATLTPVFYSNEAPLYRGEFRLRTRTGWFLADGSVTWPERDSEQLTPNEEPEVRNHIRLLGGFRINPTWHWGFIAAGTSDDTYLRRYEIEESSQLVNTIYATGIDGLNYARARAFYYQGLRARDDQGQIPIILPDAVFEYYLDEPILGGRTSVRGSFLGLTRTEGSDISRLSFGVGWERTLRTSGGHLFKLFGDARGDFYQTNDLQEGPIVPSSDEDREQIARVYPYVGLEWHYPLMRSFGARSLIFEPIGQVVFSPEGGNPEEIPNEDSLSFEFDDTNLFTPNKFPGLDLVEPGARFNVGLKSTLVGFGPGENSFLIGRTFRPKSQEVFEDDTGLESGSSDWVGRLILQPHPLWQFEHRFRIDDVELDYQRSEIGTRFGTRRTYVDVDYVNLAEELSDLGLGQREELYARGGVGLSENWSFYAAGRRDLEESDWIRTEASLLFLNPCAEFSVNFTRRYTQDRDVRPDNTVFFRIKLRNIG